MRLAEGHVMTDTSTVPCKRDDEPPSRPPLVDQDLADQLLGNRPRRDRLAMELDEWCAAAHVDIGMHTGLEISIARPSSEL